MAIFCKRWRLDIINSGDRVEINATEVENDEASFLSNIPAGTRFTNSTRLLGRVRRASEAISDELGGVAEKPREVADSPLGPFSGIRVEARVTPADEFYNPNGALKVLIYGKEQLAAGLDEEPALTFTLMPDGELSVNGPAPGGETFKQFQARGWADQAKAGTEIAENGSALKNPEGGKLPMAQVLGPLADVHARVRAWKQEDKTGLYWSRATGSSAGLGDSGAVVFFQEAAGGEVILATTSTGKVHSAKLAPSNEQLRIKEQTWQRHRKMVARAVRSHLRRPYSIRGSYLARTESADVIRNRIAEAEQARDLAASSEDGVNHTTRRDAGEFQQTARGSFNPATNTIALLKKADQAEFLSLLRRFGGVAFLARDCRDVLRELPADEARM